MSTRHAARGFTLLEILVAMVILAVMGLMAYRGVSEARVAVGNAESHLERLRAVQRSVQLIVADFRTLARRPVREPIGDARRPTLLRDPNGVTLVELSHGGWPNGAGTPRGTVQRVVYRLEDGKLFRDYSTVMDATLATPPVRRELLDRVERVELRYLTNGRQWIAEWPPFNNTGDLNQYIRPMAVEVTLVLSDYGEIRRVIEVSG
jgi:general secretion pathway protein J